MDITEVSVLHHVVLVLALLWLLSSISICHPIIYILSLVYLYLVNESYTLRLQKKIRFEEKKQANQKRILSDSESVRWLNYAVEKIWPICMENIASQKMLLPIVPWFLEKYKPWMAEKAIVQQLYLGRRPPMFTEIRVLHQSSDDDHLVMELGMNFLAANDMSAIIAVQLRKPFGMWANLHMTGMHVEGKVLVGVKFLQNWPFLGRLRICFTDPPYFQMTVKPLFNHGLNVTEVPGIAGWLDNLLAVAFEQTLVAPNMLVVDMEKFVEAPTENWFSVNEKDPIAYAKVEIIEAADLKAADLNGLSDPFVKGQIGAKSFKSKVQKKTLTPKWLEEFKISIHTWESPNVLAFEVLDKDHFFNDTLGNCSINISDLRGGQRHEIWLPLQNVKMGRLHLAVTVTDNVKDVEQHTRVPEKPEEEEEKNMKPSSNQTNPDATEPKTAPKLADDFEPISIEGKPEISLWVHRPGSAVSQTWEPRKGKSRRADNEILREDNNNIRSPNSAAYGSNPDGDNSSSDENSERSKSRTHGAVHRSLKKIGSVFSRKGSGKENSSVTGEESPTTSSVKQVNETMPVPDKESLSLAMSPSDGSRKGIMNGLKHAFSKKGSNESRSPSTVTEDYHGSDSSNEEPSSKQKHTS